MGIEYCLVKQNKKERYELGKPNWCHIFEKCQFYLPNYYSSVHWLYQKILSEIAHEFVKRITLQYFFNLAEDIYFWCGNDIIRFFDEPYFMEFYNLSNETIAQEEFPYTGSRYMIDFDHI